MRPNKWLVVGVLIATANLRAQTKTAVVEEIVARVNDDIITTEDLAHAKESLALEVRQSCQACTPAQIDQQMADKEKNLLRDLIDQSLLVQRAKDSGIKVDTDVIKRLDAIRQQNKLPDMDALEREVVKSGQDFEDFKKQISDSLLTEAIIRKEAGSHIIVNHEEVVKYYDEHKSDFVRPETVVLREIFVSTEGKPESDIPALKKKAEGLRDRVLKNGDDFGEMAKHFSDSPTAQQGQGGELGSFERSQLDPKIADKVFALNHGEMTDVIETKTGFEILQVEERFEAGQQPVEKVEPEITDRLYNQKMDPALRDYLKTLREDSYVQIKPGYMDTAAVETQPITEVSASNNTEKKDDPKKETGPQIVGASGEENRHMKPVFVSALQPDQSITSFFLVCEKEIRSTREGKSYLRLELGDRTGTVEARMWEGFERDAATFDRDDFVKVQARVESYRNKLQISVDKVRRAEEHEVDPADFFPHTAEDIEQLYGKLLSVVASVGDPWLRRLLESVIGDNSFVARFKRAPAAKKMHHAYLGGLLEHVVSLCGLCRVVASHYPEADADLLLTGAVLHDVGKVDELSYERSLGYTDEGQMLGHIMIEYEWISRKIDAIEGFPPALKTLVQHMIISHHGQYAFGSPKLPMFREALMLHYLDDLDSKMSAVRNALASDEGEGNWTAWTGALERRFLRTDRYLHGETKEPGAQSAASGRTDNGIGSGGKK